MMKYMIPRSGYAHPPLRTMSLAMEAVFESSSRITFSVFDTAAFAVSMAGKRKVEEEEE